ncbi:MAG TPA: hypothetical protein VF396_11720, partial [Bradyrhizobium sp.]
LGTSAMQRCCHSIRGIGGRHPAIACHSSLRKVMSRMTGLQCIADVARRAKGNKKNSPKLSLEHL